MKFQNSLFTEKKILPIGLSIFIIYGLINKLLISLNLSLHSDTAYPGIICMEIAMHNNYLLKGFYLFSSDSGIFHDIIPFHLIPQLITGYDPTALKIMAFIIFVLLIFVFTYIVYKYSNNLICALIFATLMANMDPISYYHYSQPSYHIVTIIMSGIFLILMLENIDRHKPIEMFIIIAFMNLVIFSDAIFMSFFLIPFTIYYVLFTKKKTMQTSLSLIIIYVLIILIYLFNLMIIKNLGLMIFNSYPVRIMDVSGILRSIGFFINNLLILYSSNLFMALNGSTALGIFELLSLISSLLLICLIFARYKKFDDSKIKNIYLLGILIILSILIPYMLVFGINQSTERYLTIIIVFTFMLISFLYLIEDKYKKITIFLILCLMLVNMLNNFNYVDKLNYHPNNDEYELISYLKLNNLSYGYGNYWDANINTYLSKEDVVIRPVYFSEDGIRPMRQISDEDWYDSIPNQYFIILNNNNINEVISFNNMLYSHPPETIYSYKNYNIYKYYRDESTGNMLLFN